MKIMKIRQPDGTTVNVPFGAGAKGDNGKSAYEYALDGGYTGTEEEFAAKLAVPFVTPQMFGAKGDGVTDDTAAIQAALDSLTEGGTIYFPKGKYIVQHSETATGQDYIAVLVQNKSGITVIFDNASVIKHNLTSVGRYSLFSFYNCENLEIKGGIIEADRNEHPDVITGYGSRAIDIKNSNNVYIHNMEVRNVFGDGIGASGTSKQCKNILIENCTIHDCYRNGITIGGIKRGIVKNCHIYNISGGAPEAGIDIEAEYGFGNEDITIEDCYIHDCTQATIAFSSNGNGTKVIGCNLVGRTMSVSTHDNVEIENTKITGGLSVKGKYTLRNCTINGFDSYGGIDYPNVDFKAYNTIFIGNTTSATFLVNGIQNSASYYFKDCDISHLENSSYSLFDMLNAGDTSVIIEGGKINLYNSSLDTPLTSGIFSSFSLKGCQVLVNSNTIGKNLLGVNASTVQMVDNIIDMSNVVNYSSDSVAIFDSSTNILNCHANVFILSTNIQQIINLMAFGGTAYLTQNTASIASNFCSSSGGTIFEHDNTTSESTDIITDNIITEVKGYVDGKIAEINANGIQQTPLFANSIDECTDTTKVYVLPNGYIYGYVAVTYDGGIPQFTNVLPLAIDSNGEPYGDGLGYKSGIYLSTSGEEIDSIGHMSTGFIKCNDGDVIRIQGFTRSNNGNIIIPYIEDFTKYGNPIYPSKDLFDENGIFIFTAAIWSDSGEGYVRIGVGSIASNAIVTINEEITYSEPITTYEWTNLGIQAFVPAERFLALEAEVAALKESISQLL